MLYFTTRLISRIDPIKYIFEKPALIGDLSLVNAVLFDIVFMTRKAIKGQNIVGYLVDQP